MKKIQNDFLNVVVSKAVKPGEVFLISGLKPKILALKKDEDSVRIKEVPCEGGGVKFVVVADFPDCDFLDCLKLINFQ